LRGVLRFANSLPLLNSKIQRADQLVEQWITIHTEHEKAHLNEALPHIERQLQKAHDARATLEDTEENNRVE
jgi:hypothetical protein